MNSHSEDTVQLHKVTPVLHSQALSKLLPQGAEVYLKLENAQPTGSFKIRGIGRLVSKLKNEGCKKVIGSSGGNAGVATSYIAQLLGVPCTIYVPKITSLMLVQRIQDFGAEVKRGGNIWAEADVEARKEAEKPGNAYISPYNDPELWAGHATMIYELKNQLPQKPSALVVAVGGGGLLLGVLEGLQNVGWQDVPIVTMETYGADCFNLSLKAKKLVVLDKMTSIATCLGASCVAPHLLEVIPNFNIISQVVSDPLVVESCIRFADDERILVEPACGAALAAVYGGILEKLQKEGELPPLTTGPVVIIVCGGGGVSLKMLQDWADMLNITFPP